MIILDKHIGFWWNLQNFLITGVMICLYIPILLRLSILYDEGSLVRGGVGPRLYVARCEHDIHQHTHDIHRTRDPEYYLPVGAAGLDKSKRTTNALPVIHKQEIQGKARIPQAD